MTLGVVVGEMDIDRELYDFVNKEACTETGITPEQFWKGFELLLHDLGPRNAALLARRDELQAQIDDWHRIHPGADFDAADYHRFLEAIGYLEPPVGDFKIDTAHVDAEIGTMAAPQLVVPLDNARYALNAANARWGSLYDALYGTDAISQDGGAHVMSTYNPVRGALVVKFGRDFLDENFPLIAGSHRDVASYSLSSARTFWGTLVVILMSGETTTLRDSAAYRGYTGPREAPQSFLMMHHGLHVEIVIDPRHPVGATDAAGVADIVLESAVTTIQDCEDSVAAVDAGDKVRVYRNWLGLMTGSLRAQFTKNGKKVERTLNADRRIYTPTGVEITLPGRSLMLVRHVGSHLMSDAVLFQGAPIPETFLDAAVTALIAMHDLIYPRACRNSRRGAIYMVKPKMHGSAEAAFADELFERVEDVLSLKRYTLKMGLMDEERRTSLNLSQCIYAARHRLIFINTGFLDRSGDEIRTSLEAGPVVRRSELRQASWLAAYEQQNVDLGIRHGLPGKAQIGKGMWTMPDRMQAMLSSKLDHPQAGASTAWVPSPTAATLHTLHYHKVDVHRRQASLAQRPKSNRRQDLLSPPLAGGMAWTIADIEQDIDSYTQGILGYVVRWIEFGIGCSKVPDLQHVGHMEDRATLRIASQHLASWLRHGICTQEQVEKSLLSMVFVVDQQNAGDPAYRPMASDIDRNIAFAAAKDLIFLSRDQPNGYTESVLQRYRRFRKSGLAD